MPKVLSHTPSWLSRPSPGFDIFASTSRPTSSKAPNGNSASQSQGPHRKIAARGAAEVFIASGKDILWTDLLLMKDKEEELFGRRSQRLGSTVRSRPQDGSLDETLYRVLKVPGYGQITRLVISPDEQYLAVCTSHTVYVVVLPASSRLGSDETGLIKPKSFQVGSTCHVVEHAPLASVLWHPLGEGGHCLVTVATDAIVRLFETDQRNRHSFDTPKLSIDLKKLANATTSDMDFGASNMGARPSFSLDSVEMEVAAACFGNAPGQSSGSGWAGMTLWIAMTEGDVYALCPLLPSRWQFGSATASDTCLKALGESIAGKATSEDEEVEVPAYEKDALEQQLRWFAGIETIEQSFRASVGGEKPAPIYTRPSYPGIVPKLQGPFELDNDFDEDDQITDILVMPLARETNIDDENEEGGENTTELVETTVIGAVICLSTDTNKVHVCLELDGVEGSWLPNTKRASYSLNDTPEPQLLLLESIQYPPGQAEASSLPTLTLDPYIPYLFYATSSVGVTSFSIASWVNRLVSQLSSDNSSEDFKLDMFLSSAKAILDTPIRPQSQILGTPSSVTVLRDSDLKHFLLTTISGIPHAAVLDTPAPFTDAYDDDDTFGDHPYEPPELLPHHSVPPRSIYQAHQNLYQESALPVYLTTGINSRYKSTLKDQVNFSPATMEMLETSHRIVMKEVLGLQDAVAEMFRQCERLRDEYVDQIEKVRGLAARIDAISGTNYHDEEGEEGQEGDNGKLDRRIEMVNKRQDELSERCSRLRGKLAGLGREEMSVQEETFAAEVERFTSLVEKEDSIHERDVSSKAPWRRFEEVKRLKDELVPLAEETGGEGKAGEGKQKGVRVPEGFRKQRVAQVMEMLDRESVLVEAAAERLERLKLMPL